MRIAESLRTKCANKQKLAIVFSKSFYLDPHRQGLIPVTMATTEQDMTTNGALWLVFTRRRSLFSPWRLSSMTTSRKKLGWGCEWRRRRGGSSVLTRRTRGWRHGSDQTVTAVLELNTWESKLRFGDEFIILFLQWWCRAGLMAAEKRRRQESYGLDAINSSSSVATLETRRALQGSLRDEFIDHKWIP